MNGLRSSLTNSLNALGVELKELLENESEFVKEQVNEAFDNVAREVGVLNCIFNAEDADFIDMSEKLTVISLGDDC